MLHRSSAAGVPTLAAPRGCPQVCPEVHRELGRNALAGRQRFDHPIFVAQQVRAYQTLIEQRQRPTARIAS